MTEKHRRPTTHKAVLTEPAISPDELRWRHHRLRLRTNATATHLGSLPSSTASSFR